MPRSSSVSQSLSIEDQIDRIYWSRAHRIDVTLYSARDDVSITMGPNMRLRRRNGWYSVQCAARSAQEVANIAVYDGHITRAQLDLIPARRRRSSSSSAGDCCTICLDELGAGPRTRRIKTMPCRHEFHAHCIDRWLIVNGLCPVCRFDIRAHIDELTDHYQIVHAQV